MEQQPKPAEAPKPKSRTMMLAIIIIVILVVVGVGVYILTRPPSQTIGDNVSIWDTSGACLQTATPPDCGFKDATSGNSNTTVTVGTTVQWTNNGGQAHTVTSCDPAKVSAYGASACPNTDSPSSLTPFDSGSMSGSGTFRVTFNTAGTYYYFCYIHAWMHGEVIVH